MATRRPSEPPPARVIVRRRLVAIGGLALLAFLAWFFLLSGESPFFADKRGASVDLLTIQSKAVGQDEPVKVVVPKGADGETRPLLVFLHGRGGDENSELVSEMYSALADQGDRAPVIAFPDGGDSSYWHDRDTGDWSKYVTDEVIPEVESRYDVDPKRIGIGGISMGGYGAYEIAAENPGEFCAVGGHSPALWQEAGETAEGAFDDADDFDSHDVIARAQNDPAAFSGSHLWLDAGDQDPFQPGDQAMTGALKTANADLIEKTFPGGHEGSYWDAHWGDYLSFYAKALANC